MAKLWPKHDYHIPKRPLKSFPKQTIHWSPCFGGSAAPREHAETLRTERRWVIAQPSLTHRIQSYGRLILTWLGFLLMVNGKAWIWHTDPSWVRNCQLNHGNTEIQATKPSSLSDSSKKRWWFSRFFAGTPMLAFYVLDASRYSQLFEDQSGWKPMICQLQWGRTQILIVNHHELLGLFEGFQVCGR